jgi:predicted CDP-diglyceride synthetase/phosphatidate cytidylyltransferase
VRVIQKVFLDQLGKDATKKLDAKARLRSWWIGMIHCILSRNVVVETFFFFFFFFFHFFSGAVENVFIERKDKRHENILWHSLVVCTLSNQFVHI